MTARKFNSVDTVVFGGKGIIHFYPGRHYYKVSVPTLDIYRAYQPGCTSIIGMKDKSGPLMGWVANQCEVYARQAVTAYTEGGAENVPVDRLFEIFSKMKQHFRDVRQEAADIGKAVHAYLHRYLEERLKDHDAELVSRPSVDEYPDFTPEMFEGANQAVSAGIEWIDKHELIPLRMEAPVWSPTHAVVGTDDFIGYVDGELSVIDYKTSSDLYPEVWLQTALYQAAYEEEHPHLKIESRWGINVRKDGVLVAEKRERNTFDGDLQAFLGLNKVWNWNAVEVEGREPITVVGPLASTEAGDWIDELEAEGKSIESDKGNGQEALEVVRAEG